MLMVRVSVEVPPEAIIEGAKPLVMVGASAVTVKVEFAVKPVPALVEVTLPVVLEAEPGVLSVTLTVMLQFAPPLIDAPLRLMLPEPTVLLLSVPLVHVVVPTVAMVMPAGNVSLTPTPVICVLAFGLVMVIVIVDVPPAVMLVGLKPLVIVGFDKTVSVADAVPPVPSFVELTAPVVLTLEPVLVAVTFAVRVQLLLAEIEPPLRLTLPEPAVAVNVPPHVLLAPFGVATTTPEGSVSLTATPDIVAAFELVIVMVRVEVEVDPTPIVVGANALLIVGAETTVTVGEVAIFVRVPPLPSLVCVVKVLTPVVAGAVTVWPVVP